jgi:hypothetical protein
LLHNENFQSIFSSLWNVKYVIVTCNHPTVQWYTKTFYSHVNSNLYSQVLWDQLFLDTHISEIMWYLSFCAGLISLSNNIWFHPCCCKWQDFIFLMSEYHSIAFIYHILKSPFISWWTVKLFPFLVYCEQCYNKHGSANVSLTHWFNFLCLYTQ